eukprot:gene6237-7768_t
MGKIITLSSQCKILFILLILSGIVVQSEICDAEKCGDIGSVCSVHEHCKPNSYCKDGVCTGAKKDREYCENSFECHVGYQCVNEGSGTVCRGYKYMGLGESCKDSSDCYGSLECKKGYCEQQDSKCNVHEDCRGHQYCSKGECIDRLIWGKPCMYGEDLCGPGLVCGAKDNSMNGSCIERFTKGAGEKCFAQFGECNMADGLICPSDSGLISSCQPPSPNIQCKTNTDCDSAWETCQCNTPGTPSTCEPRFYINSQCLELFRVFAQCIANWNCAHQYNAPNTKNQNHPDGCIIRNCGQEAACYYSGCLKEEFPCGIPSNLPNCTLAVITHTRPPKPPPTPKPLTTAASTTGNSTVTTSSTTAGAVTSNSTTTGIDPKQIPTTTAPAIAAENNAHQSNSISILFSILMLIICIFLLN